MKETTLNQEEAVKIAKEVFGVTDEKEISKYGDFINLSDIMMGVLEFEPEKVRDFIIKLGKLGIGIKIERKLPDDCLETVKEINTILTWHKDQGYKQCSPDIIVEAYNKLLSHKARLGALTAWYSAQATLSTMNRRNWRAGMYTVLRSCGKDMETNIRKKMTVKDGDEQAEMLSFIHIKNQAYLGYVAEELQNLLMSCKDVMYGLKEILIELRHQRNTDADLKIKK